MSANETKNIVEIFTDGACSGNPGPGGWGAILRWNGNEREISGGARDTTNNRMEMMAALEAIRAMKRSMPLHIYTDSTYVRDGITKWIHAWKAKNWKTAAKKPVKNKDLWQALEEALAGHDVTWHWVKGHAGHPENERADALARAALEDYR